ncbi:RNA-binding cell elongation regulator Jag/EloR [Lysinibacillus odysseyi]|uniref:RNA-binding protein KhpB n=1 Tax=Lysinibacillus odysseyi 34hs-1 = NBRC 100172 TaxID=1220589 RepID=A0A0A3ITR6_9BACI|nr:RNA-binding cell elongation regulator Jag/EloR [Lysinibacillus odysseyi]KGR86820.1 protein jag [Lysinibacillus odysseyi 34hs-1 = NBRC 100172]
MNQLTQSGATVNEAISLALQKLGKTRDQVEVEVLQEGKKGFLGFGARDAEVRITVKAEVQTAGKEETETISQPNILPEEKPNQVSSAVLTEDEEEHGSLSSVSAVIENGDELVQNVNDDRSTTEEQDPIEETKTYLKNIALELGVTDLKIYTESEGKYVSFKLKSEKAAFLIGKRGQTLNALQQLTQLILNKTAKSFMLVRLDVEDYRERRQASLEQLAERMADKAIRTRRKVTLEPMPSYERKIIHNVLANRLDIETYSEGVEPNRYLVIEPIK